MGGGRGEGGEGSKDQVCVGHELGCLPLISHQASLINVPPTHFSSSAHAQCVFFLAKKHGAVSSDGVTRSNRQILIRFKYRNKIASLQICLLSGTFSFFYFKAKKLYFVPFFN